jgi:hypothetical protein
LRKNREQAAEIAVCGNFCRHYDLDAARVRFFILSNNTMHIREDMIFGHFFSDSQHGTPLASCADHKAYEKVPDQNGAKHFPLPSNLRSQLFIYYYQGKEKVGLWRKTSSGSW